MQVDACVEALAAVSFSNDLWAGKSIDTFSGICVRVLTDVDASIVVVAMTGLYLAMLSPWVVSMLSNVEFLTNEFVGLRSCYAGLDTLVPRVVKFCVTNTSTVFEPRTSATATTHSARFRDGAASRAYRNSDRRRACQCFYVALVNIQKDKLLL